MAIRQTSAAGGARAGMMRGSHIVPASISMLAHSTAGSAYRMRARRFASGVERREGEGEEDVGVSARRDALVGRREELWLVVHDRLAR